MGKRTVNGRVGPLMLLFFALFPILGHAQFQLNGAAKSLGSGCYEITPDEPWQFGSIWSTNKVDLSESFVVEADLYFGDKNYDGADGLVFVLQQQSVDAGSNGGGIGYMGITPSVAVEFDTHQNYSDPASDHIAVISNGVVNHNTPNTLAGPVSVLPLITTNIEDGQFHQVKIAWDASLQKLGVTIDCQFRLAYQGDIVKTIFQSNPMVFWGFTGATGAKSNLQKVCYEYVSFDDELIDAEVCMGETTQLDAGDGVSFFWSPSEGLSDAGTRKPMASPPHSMLYRVTITDICGDTRTDDVNVQVNAAPPEFTLGADTAICEGEAFAIGTEVPEAQSYRWQDGWNGTYAIAYESMTYVLEVQHRCALLVDSIQVIVMPLPELELATEVFVCPDEAVDILKLDTAVNYRWNDGFNQGNRKLTAPGLYWLEAESLSCINRDSIQITLREAPEVHLPADTTMCMKGDTVPVFPKRPDLTYTWQDGSTADFFPLRADQDQELHIEVEAQDVCQRTAIDDFWVTIKNCACEAWIPNAFTPNRPDGLNDAFRPKMDLQTCVVAQYRFQIYNRWGQKVFETTDPQKAWDGRSQGQTVQSGVYSWKLGYMDSSNDIAIPHTDQGSVTIPRSP